MKILVLGGTREARELAEALIDAGHAIITSLAGRTEEVSPIAGEIRRGGFGGPDGLASYLIENTIDLLIDATHPFAAIISANAVLASHKAGVPLIRLCRPAWQAGPDDNWSMVAGVAAAVDLLPSGARVLLTTGHRDLERFLGRADCRFVVRLIEAPGIGLPAHCELLLSRPPYRAADEQVLLRDQRITHLVTKNAGGAGTGKLEAARALGLPVIMIDRPALPPAREVQSVDAALVAIQSLVS